MTYTPTTTTILWVKSNAHTGTQTSQNMPRRAVKRQSPLSLSVCLSIYQSIYFEFTFWEFLEESRIIYFVRKQRTTEKAGIKTVNREKSARGRCMPTICSFILCVYMCVKVHMCHGIMYSSQIHPEGVGCGSQGYNSDHQVWRQAALLAKPSCWSPNIFFSETQETQITAWSWTPGITGPRRLRQEDCMSYIVRPHL